VKYVKAELWNVKVCDSVLHMVHEAYYNINEYFIPSYNISFNIVQDNVNVLVPDEGRYSKENAEKKQEVQVPEPFAKSLKQYLNLRKRIQKDAIEIVVHKEK